MIDVACTWDRNDPRLRARSHAREPAKGEADKAKREMKKTVGKFIEDKKKEPIGIKEAEEQVAADLNDAAHQDTKKG